MCPEVRRGGNEFFITEQNLGVSAMLLLPALAVYSGRT